MITSIGVCRSSESERVIGPGCFTFALVLLLLPIIMIIIMIMIIMHRAWMLYSRTRARVHLATAGARAGGGPSRRDGARDLEGKYYYYYY